MPNVVTSADDLLGTTLDIKQHRVKRTGKTVFLRELPAAEQGLLRKIFAKAEKGFDIDDQISYLLATVCDEDGKPILEEKHRAALKKEPASVISDLFLAALSVGGLTQNEVNEEKKA